MCRQTRWPSLCWSRQAAAGHALAGAKVRTIVSRLARLLLPTGRLLRGVAAAAAVVVAVKAAAEVVAVKAAAEVVAVKAGLASLLTRLVVADRAVKMLPPTTIRSLSPPTGTDRVLICRLGWLVGWLFGWLWFPARAYAFVGHF